MSQHSNNSKKNFDLVHRAAAEVWRGAEALQLIVGPGSFAELVDAACFLYAGGRDGRRRMALGAANVAEHGGDLFVV